MAREYLNLRTYKGFKDSIKDLVDRYREKDSKLALHAVERLTTDLQKINEQFYEEYNRVIFTTVEGRVKSEDSFFRKMYNYCKGGIEEDIFNIYKKITDLAGVRFACPYYDEVEFAIEKWIRPKLKAQGYIVDLNQKGLKDKNLLDIGDELGYRAYHFFVEVPVIVDIYGKEEFCLCEVQGRSELQHVWAAKSHDLLYKPKGEWDIPDEIKEDMRQLSNTLRAADGFFVSIRNRVRKTNLGS